MGPCAAPTSRLPSPLLPQHPDSCGVSVHPECTGQPFPTGSYICMNHDSRELKTRMRRKRSAARGRGSGDEGGDDDSEATVSEASTKSLDSEATEDEGDGTSSAAQRKRAKVA